MKKIFSLTIITLFSYSGITAQTSYGITGGYYSYIEKINLGGLSASESAPGFFIGFFGEFPLKGNFKLQAESQFTSVFHDSRSLQQLVVPVLLKYPLDDKFSIAAGPQFDYVFQDLALGKQFGIAISTGLFYDFSKRYYATVRYAFGVTERVQDNLDDLSGGISGAHLGIGFRF